MPSVGLGSYTTHRQMNTALSQLHEEDRMLYRLNLSYNHRKTISMVDCKTFQFQNRYFWDFLQVVTNSDQVPDGNQVPALSRVWPKCYIVTIHSNRDSEIDITVDYIMAVPNDHMHSSIWSRTHSNSFVSFVPRGISVAFAILVIPSLEFTPPVPDMYFRFLCIKYFPTAGIFTCRGY